MSLLQLLCERPRMVLFCIFVAGLGLLWNWPHDFSSWMLLLCWLLGVTSFMFLTRAYLAPYVVMRFSSRIRVRSVSLRSIRGLYFRKGNRIWQVDRLGYSYGSSADGKPKGLFLKIEGLNLQIESPPDARSTSPPSKHRRGLTLADLSPSPLALYLWSIISELYSYFDPIIRPIVRFVVTYLLSQVIHSIPRLTETVQIEIDKAILSIDATLGMRIAVENVMVKGHVSFIRNPQPNLNGDHSVSHEDHTLSARALAMGAWKSRLAKGFQRTWTRTWDRTLGQTTGSVAFELTLQDVKGFTPHSSLFLASTLHDQPAMCCSQALVTSCSARFSPRNGSMEPGSLYTQTSLGAVYMNVDVLQTFLTHMTTRRTAVPPISPSTAALRSPAISPWLKSPFSTPSSRSTFIASHMENRARRSVTPIECVARVGFSLKLLTLSKTVDEKNYSVVMRDLACSCQSGNTDENVTHREWLGRQPFPSPSAVYSFSFAVQGVSVERSNNMAHSSFRMLHIGSTSIESVVVEWLAVSPKNTFLRGDPNAPCVFLDFKVASLSFTDRLDILLQHLTEPFTSKGLLPQESGPVLPTILSPVPRLVLNAAIGRLSVHLIGVDVSTVEEPFSVEMETDGINLTSSSNFRTGAAAALNNLELLELEGLPLHMSLSFNCHLHPFFVRLRSTCKSTVTLAKGMSKWGTEAINSDKLFSLEAVEVNGVLTALGEINDDDSSICATLDTSSMFLDLHCRTEATLLELWDPERLKILKMFVRLLLPFRNSFTLGPTLPRTPSPPIGCILSFSVARSVLFVTSPDINPDADPEITRGVALSTGVSVRYCAGNLEQKLSYSQSLCRQKLCLPVDRRRDATTSTKACEAGKGNETYGKVTFWNTTVRSAAADKFSMDDPHSTERDSPLLEKKQLLVIKNSELDLRFRLPMFTAYDTTFSIDDVKLSFELSLIYSALLAVRTIQAMWQSRPQTSMPHSRSSPVIKGTIKAFRMRLNLPGQDIVARANHMDLLFNEDRTQCTINSFLVWVLVLSLQKHSLGGMPKERWEEIGRLHRCTLSKVTTLRDQIKVDSDSLRIRIPSGYVVADLQLATVVTVKAIRHMIKMVAAGRFTQMPAPAAETPKIMPSVTFTCRMLCMEAADDPFESQLGFNYKIGLEAAKARVRREEAFDAKVSAVTSGNLAASSAPFILADYRFDGQHAIPIQEARWRLDMTHTLDWLLRYQQRRRERVTQEDLVYKELYGNIPLKRPSKAPDLIKPTDRHHVPPLLRASVFGFRLHLNRQSFPLEHLTDFLHEQGNGLPHETPYSLLIPMHLNIALASLQITIRDYPLPLLCIPAGSGGSESPSLLFDSDLVVAEEMGPLQSVEWITCSFTSLGEHCTDNPPVSLLIPKTIMPVKTYARPSIQVLTDQITAFAWGISYGPAIQDVVKVLEGLSPESRDPSPQIGFWDKLRLNFHWRIQISFKQEVRLYMKGTRNPYVLENEGAGFALCWQGVPAVKIGFPNDNRELVQVTSDTMSIIIPRFSGGAQAQRDFVSGSDCLKSCAKLSSGVLFGVGVAFERTCDAECKICTGSPFNRNCRLFTFRPHYDVRLLAKTSTSKTQDSYRGFRSDFIHLSISITSALQQGSPGYIPQPSSFHLTPKAFASFWSWWGLFDNGMSLPIRQGSYFPRKAISPKFSRHLATIKYKVNIPQLFISHAYINDTRECWAEGITTVVGVKAKVDHFQADLHQRDQETVAPGKIPNNVQVIRHKPFYAAEAVMKNLDLRTVRAVFSDPLKQSVPLSTDFQSQMKDRTPPSTEVSPLWFDPDDFVETDWSTQNYPEMQLLPTLSCPKLTYFKKNLPTADTHTEHSKFGDEDTHACLLGSEISVPRVEISLAEQRIATLQRMAEGESESPEYTQKQHPMSKMVFLLQEYIAHLRAVDASPNGLRTSNVENYYMPSDIVSADEWTDFENVYQVHSPKLFLSSPIRDILIQYYNCSRARRGYEYHMATRAVKFIRDQAGAMISGSADETAAKPRSSGTAAQVAATALRKILNIERSGTSLNIQAGIVSDPVHVDPLDGWEDGVILRKRHFCLLLKPQIILRSIEPPSEAGKESTAILAAVQAKLQSFNIMDARNLEDPISGNIMTRNYTSLDGLQTFCPTKTNSSGDGPVPLEVLIDYRCESNSFDRIVPQTNATCQYDRFNRLRLRNNVTSTVRSGGASPRRGGQAHLYNETDLVQLHIPRFTVSASDPHFQSISDIIANLILFSDVAHKARLEKLETLLFAYDFSDLDSAADVVSDLQNRFRSAIEIHNDVSRQVRTDRSRTNLEILKLKAHMFLLVEELNLIFDAIRLAQERTDDRTDQKSALLLHASSSEISWGMLDENRKLLAKLAVRNIDFSWLSKRDSSTANSLTVGDLQAFDGSPHAVWTEIVSKYEEPSSHPLFKRDLFLEAEWTILAPVGGITIYEKFLLDFHPIRLQLDAHLGQRIMEYVWPARRGRNHTKTSGLELTPGSRVLPPEEVPLRSSLDSSRLLQTPRTSLDSGNLAFSTRKLATSRSFTDLRSAATDSMKGGSLSLSSNQRMVTVDADASDGLRTMRKISREDRPGQDDAVEMKTRSSQKTFILVKIASLELLLSIMKAESFECRDARIRTHALEFRNQTWSFEELVDQFIPTDLTWKGWVRMAFHQPLVPVLPVARELFSKTKLVAFKGATQLDPRPSIKKPSIRRGRTATEDTVRGRPRKLSPSSGALSERHAANSMTGTALFDEPEVLEKEPSTSDAGGNRHPTRTRLLSIFNRDKPRPSAQSLPPLPSNMEYLPSTDPTES
ncbi:golgi-body localization protein domain-containing protein [Phlebopus sp. FC_14]|nr:golgi-body localization protein domain-containing protein [Phlebopus sp. FC_14]